MNVLQPHKAPPPPSPNERVKHDFYVEPVWCVRGLFSVEPFDGAIYDPACGTGTILKVCEEWGYHCSGSDIRPVGDCQMDFLDGNLMAENIVSNPPFHLAAEFIQYAYQSTMRKVAFLLPLSFLESARRKKLFTDCPLSRVIVSRSRISMPPAHVKTKWKGGVRAFAWYVWDHDYEGEPRLAWFDK